MSQAIRDAATSDAISLLAEYGLETAKIDRAAVAFQELLEKAVAGEHLTGRDWTPVAEQARQALHSVLAAAETYRKAAIAKIAVDAHLPAQMGVHLQAQPFSIDDATEAAQEFARTGYWQGPRGCAFGNKPEIQKINHEGHEEHEVP